MFFYRDILNSNIDPYFGNVSLLLKGIGTATTPGLVTTGTILDDSGNNTISVLGDAVLSPVIKKFGDYSIKFDGSGDRLQISDDARFDLSSGAFTIEAWFYCNAIDGNYQSIIAKDTFGSNFSWCLYVNSTSVLTATSNIAGDWNFTSNVTITAKTWHHVSLVGDGTNMYHYFNGVLIGTKNRTLTNASSNITVGCAGWNNPSTFFNGYIDDLRITKGGNTSLLLNGTGTRIEKTILDSSTNNHPISISGDTFLSSVVKKYGDYSISFDGTGDRLSFYPHSSLQFGTENFTIETWVNFSTLQSCFFVDARNSIQSNLWAFFFDNDTKLLYWYDGESQTGRSWNPVINTWYHIVYCRNGISGQLYVDGVSLGLPISDAKNYSISPIISYIGGRFTLEPYSVNGYIDDLRITKGVARYTSNFTPPTAELPSNSFI